MKEKEKMETFLKILELSGVGKIIEKATKKDYAGGRRSYNPYRLFSTIIYAFSKHSGSVRKIEESINYDLRFIYLMEQERPSYVTISSFLNNVVVNVKINRKAVKKFFHFLIAFFMRLKTGIICLSSLCA
ncbi:MAG: transposase [Candidatus Enterosoma sp.]|nr:transposase [Candidatus Enterosoma sp.]